MGRLPLLSIASALVLLSGASAQAASAGDALGLEKLLAHPSNADRPSMLWWWPGAAVIDRETAGEITALKRAGFGSAQIVDLEGYGDLSGPRSWQWGTPDWFARFNAALAKANASHLRIDTAPYPIWMMSSPAVSGAQQRPLLAGARPTARVRSPDRPSSRAPRRTRATWLATRRWLR